MGSSGGECRGPRLGETLTLKVFTSFFTRFFFLIEFFIQIVRRLLGDGREGSMISKYALIVGT